MPDCLKKLFYFLAADRTAVHFQAPKHAFKKLTPYVRYDLLFACCYVAVKQAKLKGNTPEADGLFAEAGKKYAEAVRIKPDMHEALYGWGNALYEQAKTKSGAEADRLFHEARSKFLQAEGIAPGTAAYDLACISALHAQEVECLEWLEKSKAHADLPTREHILNDPDLANVRDKEWFQSFMARS